MTFSDPIKSSPLIYNPVQSVQSQERAHLEKMHNLFMERSFKVQVDSQHFSDSWYGVETRTIVSNLAERMGPTIPEGAGASVLVCANGEKPRHLGLGMT